FLPPLRKECSMMAPEGGKVMLKWLAAPSRRAVLGGGLVAGASAVLAACGQAAGTPGTAGGSAQSATPKQVTFVKTNGGDQDTAWRAQFAQASQATKVTVNLEIDPDSGNFTQKRLAEYAA